MIKKFNFYNIKESVDYRSLIKDKLLGLSTNKNLILYKFGLRKIIDEFLSPIKLHVNGNRIDKYQYPLSLLYQTNKYNIKKINDKFYYSDLQGDFIFFNGEWSYLNKINTNIYSLIDILTNFLNYLFTEYSREFNKYDDDYLENLLNLPYLNINEFQNKIIEYINWKDKKIGLSLKDWLNLKYKNRYDLSEYVDNIIKNTKKGDICENIAKDFLENKGVNILYQGSNGDLIDMIFGCDLIIEKDGKILTVQVKSYSLNYMDFNNFKEYKKVDILIGVDQYKNIITLRYQNKIYEY